MDSRLLKAEAIAWLRFSKQIPVVCSEVGWYNADVLGINSDFSIEIETKTTLSDLKRDFSSKKAKHEYYASASNSRAPNYFYILIPETLKEAATPIIQAANPKYGIALYPGSDNHDIANLAGKKLRISIRAQKLHDQPPSEATREKAIKRMASELAGLYIAQNEILRLFHDSIVDTLDNIQEGTVRAMGSLDYEEMNYEKEH